MATGKKLQKHSGLEWIMSLKKLFDAEKSKKTTNLTSVVHQSLSALNSSSLDVESGDLVRESNKETRRFVPEVDYSDPANFARFGLSAQYYNESITRIKDYYPYDGSLAEKQKWRNESTYLDLYLFDSEYPRTNGYVSFGSTWTGTSTITGGWGKPTTLEYIQFKSGPHKDPNKRDTIAKTFPDPGNVVGGKASIYDENIDDLGKSREGNLQFAWKDGACVEFWMKKGAWLNASTDTVNECIFQLSGSDDTESVGHELAIFLSGSGNSTKIFTHYGTYSGKTFTKSALSASLNTGLTSIADNSWHHYAINIKPVSTTTTLELYVDGVHTSELASLTTPTVTNVVSGALVGTIGACGAQIDTSFRTLGYGKLKADLDEFRFWRKARTAKEIGRFWNSQVGGGTNTDIANVDLGVYYKFNEGTVGSSSIDKKVIDYSGRVSNGTWVGYASGARSADSAIVESGASSFEFKDPILYSAHPDFITFENRLAASASYHDVGNSSAIYNTLPAWITEEDYENGSVLRNLTQIMASYLDDLYLQIQELPKLRHKTYAEDFRKPHVFYAQLLENTGFPAPKIFANVSSFTKFLNRSEKKLFEKDVDEIKNTIYQNIYNNLVYILKSKGTEAAFRNLIRCFGVGDEHFKLNIYSNNTEYNLKDGYRPSVVRKNYINFNDPDEFEASVYQHSDPTNSDSTGFIYGTLDQNDTDSNPAEGSIANTYECEVIFPKRASPGSTNFVSYPYLTSSLFGVHQHNTASTADDTGFPTPNYANFQVHAVRSKIYSNDVYFVLTSSGDFSFKEIASPVFKDVYNNQKWNFAVRVKPRKFDLADFTSGSFAVGVTGSNIEFYGISTVGSYVNGEFSLSASIPTYLQGVSLASHSRRVYVGAHRQHMTASTVHQRTDTKISSMRVWADYLDNNTIKAHAFDPENYGIAQPYKSAYLGQSQISDVFVPKSETLILNWDFAQVSGSDTSGRFPVIDASSGSVANLNTRARYGKMGDVIKKFHTGRGDFFKASETRVFEKEYVQSAKKQLPENLHTEDTVQILREDDLQFTKESAPISTFMNVERSMYQNISQEMVNVMSSIVDYANLVGEPVDKYRQEYKNLGKLRGLFFERIDNTPDLDKYLEYFQWLDLSLNRIIEQLFPASANVSDGVRNMVESHIFERSKYRHQFPTLEMKQDDPSGSLESINKLLYNWKYGHAPLTVGGTREQLEQPEKQAENCLWWDKRSLEDGLPHSPRDLSAGAKGSEDIDQNYRQVMFKAEIDALRRSWTTPYKYTVDFQDKFRGGIQTKNSKYNLYKATRGVVRVEAAPAPSDGSGDQIGTNCDDDAALRLKYDSQEKIKVVIDGNIYKPAGLPVRYYSTSDTTEDQFAAHQHLDVYEPDYEVPMQGPFTEKYVGGSAHRKVPATTAKAGTAGNTTRPEAWLFDGPEEKIDNPFNVNADHARADFYGGGEFGSSEMAKRPMNIRNVSYATSTLGLPTIIGNYQKNYEVVQTSDRMTNNLYFRSSNGAEPNSISSPYVLGMYDFEVPNRGRNETVIVERFSAPGGIDTMNEGYLDVVSAQYSVYNALPYRNLIVREPLRDLLSKPMAWGGYQSGSSVTASFHKVNHNPLTVLKHRGADASAGYVTASLEDNWFVQHMIPRSDIQYSWIADSYKSTDVYGYATGSKDITFISASALGMDMGSAGTNFYPADPAAPSNIAGITAGGKHLPDTFVPLNNVLRDPITASTNMLGLPLDQSVVRYTIYEINPNSLMNDTFGASLPANTGPILNSLNSRRNGPYGYPSWKQTRAAQHPVARHQRRNNTISIVEPVTVNGTIAGTDFPKFQGGHFSHYIEPAVISKYSPLVHKLTVETDQVDFYLGADEGSVPVMKESEIIIQHTYANNKSDFSHDELNKKLGIDFDSRLQMYDHILDLYKTDVIKKVNHLKYKETLWPREKNSFLARSRKRLDYAELQTEIDAQEHRSFWRDNIIDRERRTLNTALNSQNRVVAGTENKTGLSVWPLDTFGELRLNHSGTATSPLGRALPWLTASACYTRISSSHMAHWQQGRTGGGIGGASEPSTSKYALSFYWTNQTLPTPDNRYWIDNISASSNLRAPRNPWFDSYEDFSEDIKRFGKDHSIIPEFRISEHMDYFVNQKGGNFSAPLPGFLSIDGASSDEAPRTNGILDAEDAFGNSLAASGRPDENSSSDNFYKYYAEGEFNKYFKILRQDHKDKKTKIKLECRGIMKLLPYNGFYPVLRSVQMATLFSSSYGSAVSGGENMLTGPDNTLVQRKQAGYAGFLTPFYSPGIFYNTVKSGVAVDYSVHTSIADLGADVEFRNSVYAAPEFRVPFEAIVSPREYFLSGTNIYLPVPEAKFNLTCSFSGRTSNLLYDLAANNYFAEVSNFFLQNKRNVVLASKAEPFTMYSGVEYKMDVVLRKKQEKAQEFTEDSFERFIMFEGPSWPEDGFLWNYLGSGFGPPYSYRSTPAYSDEDPGYAIHAPPYFYGDSIATIAFTPTRDDKFSLDEILAGATIAYSNLDNFKTGWMKAFEAGQPATEHRMHISSSVNLTGKTKVKQVTYSAADVFETDRGQKFKPVSISDDPNAPSAWVISPKFECPVMNFSETVLEEETGGMWTHYGKIPTQKEGVTLQIREQDPVLASRDPRATKVGSLAKVCGFDTKEKYVGQLASQKEISEAIVVIPLRPQQLSAMGAVTPESPYYFDKQTLAIALGEKSPYKGQDVPKMDLNPKKSIEDMAERMQKYVFPPHLDFLTNREMTPFGMYIFEFEDTLSKQDLANIWQGVMPDRAVTARQETVAVEHEIGPGEIFQEDFQEGTRWIIFKVKRKARTNYFATTADQSDDDRFKFDFKIGAQGSTAEQNELPYSYNWPYDYFSLVELAKIDAEVTFEEKEEEKE